jgi:hypothetical protein
MHGLHFFTHEKCKLGYVWYQDKRLLPAAEWVRIRRPIAAVRRGDFWSERLPSADDPPGGRENREKSLVLSGSR